MANNLSSIAMNAARPMVAMEIERENHSCFSKNGSESIEYDYTKLNETMMPVFKILSLVLLAIVGTAIGIEFTWNQVVNHVKTPASIVIVMVIQFFIKPLFAYVLIKSSAIPKDQAAVVLILSCSPSQVFSNAFTYFCEGDLALSVILSVTSAVLMMVMIPLNLWIYGHTENMMSPYEFLSLYPAYLISFLIVGMFLKWKFPVAAHVLSKTGIYVGQVIVVACVILQTSVFRHMFLGVPSNLYGVIVALPLLCSSLGHILAHSFRKTVPVKKTTAIDCGLQNVDCVLGIISRSSEFQAQRTIILLPWLYAFITTSSCAAFSVAYQIRKKYKQLKTKKESGFDLTTAEF